MIFTKGNNNPVDLDLLINEKIQSSSLNEILFIVPTNRKIRSLKKELISLLTNKASGRINIETIGTIASKLLNQNYVFKSMSEAASSVLLKQSVAEVKLKYLSGYKKEIPAGTLERIKNVIIEYKRLGITPEKLLTDLDSLGYQEKLKAEDIGNIYKVYKSKCFQLNTLEIGDVYEKVIALRKQDIVKSFGDLFPDVNLILINGFDEFSNPEIEIIDLIASISKTKLYLNFDYYVYNPMIFSHLNKCYDKLMNKGFIAIEENLFSFRDDFSETIRTNLFQKNKESITDKYRNKITAILALSREKEIELIAKEIKELILTNKTEPHKICVSFNLIDNYSYLIRDIFSLYGIPFNLTDRISLADSYPVISIINLLEVLENDFYYKNIFRALSGVILDLGNINLAGLMKAASELKIVAGFDNWINSLNDAINNIANDTEFDFKVNERKQQLYSKALEDIKALSQILSPFRRKLTIEEFLKELTKLIYNLNIPVSIIHNTSGKEEEEIRAVTTFLKTITEVFILLQSSYGENEKYSLSFFLEQIRTAVASARFNIKEKSNYGVQITTVNEIRGLQFDYLFISGLCDGDFPTRFNPEIFLTGDYAKSEAVHQTEERYCFYQTLCCWRKGLYLTYPLKEKGKDLVISNLLKDFLSIFEVNEKTEKDYEKFISSDEEILKLVGKYGEEKVKEKYPDLSKQINFTEALKISKARKENSDNENIYAGILLPSKNEEDNKYKLSDEAESKLTALGEREYSVTQLEQYAKCPYQYFLQRVLNIDVIQEPKEEIEAFELGTTLHSIFYKFYTKINSERIIIKQCSDRVFDKLVGIIFKIASDEIKNTAFISPFSFYEKEKILGIDGEIKNSILYKFLELERDDNTSFLPRYFELGFGKIRNENKNEISLEQLSINNVRVKGKIDRIELNEEKNQFAIVDYKLSGDKPSEKDLSSGLSLQLPLYMFAASEMLKTKLGVEYSPANALIYSLKYSMGKFGKTSISINGKKAFEDLDEQKKGETIQYNLGLIKTCGESIQKYVDAIKKGRFNLSELKDREQKVCAYCNYRAICRVHETK